MSRTGAVPRILGLLREELPALSAGTVLLVAGAGLSLVYPQGIRAIVDGAIAGRDPSRVTRIALLLAGLAVLQGAAIAGRHLLFSLAGERGVRRVRERLYASLLSQEIGFFDSSRTGELVSRLGTDCATLQNLVSAQVSMTFRHVITALGGLVLLFFTSPRLTVVMLLVVPPVAIGAVVVRPQGPRARPPLPGRARRREPRGGGVPLRGPHGPVLRRRGGGARPLRAGGGRRLRRRAPARHRGLGVHGLGLGRRLRGDGGGARVRRQPRRAGAPSPPARSPRSSSTRSSSR